MARRYCSGVLFSWKITSFILIAFYIMRSLLLYSNSVFCSQFESREKTFFYFKIYFKLRVVSKMTLPLSGYGGMKKQNDSTQPIRAFTSKCLFLGQFILFVFSNISILKHICALCGRPILCKWWIRKAIPLVIMKYFRNICQIYQTKMVMLYLYICSGFFQ